MAGLLLPLTILFYQSNAQTLNWGSSFTPAWATSGTAGTASNISGTGVNSTVNVSISGGAFTYANGVSGSLSPTVSGATATVPSSAQRMQVGVNFATDTDSCVITYTFSSLITGVSFRIVDIDKLNATSFSYVDKITVIGRNGTTPYLPTITKYDGATDPNFLVISGNVVNANPTSGQSGNTASDATDQRGTVNISFGSNVINSITIRYENHSAAQANPGVQFIAVGNMSFTQSVLPVSLLSFSGAQQGNDVKLKWATAQETNSEAYIIERSYGAAAWQPIGTVAARGNSTERTDYTYTDINPEKRDLYYRLRINDRDGRSAYSSVVRIPGKTGGVKLSAYPSPFTTQIGITVEAPAKTTATIHLTDAAGRQAIQRRQELEKGNNSFTLVPPPHLPAGIYYITITDDEQNLLGRTTVVR
ncbi:MAG: T9SS type A sorting domain-containing protein [Chitinophagaceae bacterium]|nr:T9SS type A sorting domain-containing protein [Chitinophagaceae bacterium]